MRNSNVRLTSWLLTLLLVSASAAAQDETQQALARAQSLLKQVSAQKQELETANAKLQAEVNALETKLASAEARIKSTALDLESQQRKANRTNDRLDDTRDRLTRTEGTLREAIERLRTSNAELQQSKSEAADLTAKLAKTGDELRDSEHKNLQLYQADVELLKMYRDKGPLTALLQREPFTGLKNVEIENTLLEYQAKLEESLRESNRKAVQGATAVPADK